MTDRHHSLVSGFNVGPKLQTSKFLKDACLGEIRIPSILSPPNTFILPSLREGGKCQSQLKKPLMETA